MGDIILLMQRTHTMTNGLNLMTLRFPRFLIDRLYPMQLMYCFIDKKFDQKNNKILY